MQVVKQCFERVRIIRGVNYGIITNEQIELLIVMYQLTEEQQRYFFDLLREHGIQPICDSEVPEKAKNQCSKMYSCSEQVDEGENEEADVIGKADERKRLREEKIQNLINDLKEDSRLAEQYKDELLILKKEILQLKKDGYRNAVKAITSAMLEISRYRASERLKKGWVCGTYFSRVREHSERRISYLFTEEELKDLIECCSNDYELDSCQAEIMLLILYSVPRILVHRRLVDYLD